MENPIFEYDAFISYRHTEPDITMAKKLLEAIEKYHVPFSVRRKTGIKRIKKVFRDREELPTTTDLSESIINALKNSRYLIVVCSPRTPLSEWVKKEIETFKEFHSSDKIQALLIEGEPEEAFPEPLHYDYILQNIADGSTIRIKKQLELLAADIRPTALKGESRLSYGISKEMDRKLLSKALHLLRTERLRCLAPMFGCKFDELYQRHLRRTMFNVVVTSLSLVVLLGSFLFYAINLNGQLTEQRDKAVFQQQETERQKVEVENQRKIAEQQKEIALTNEKKAIAFSNEAALQQNEARKQAELASNNEKTALNNLHEAEIQKALAISNELKANEQRDKVLRNESLYLANLSTDQLQKGDVIMSLLLGLEGLPKNPHKPERPDVGEVWGALANAVYSTNASRMDFSDFVYYMDDKDISADGKKLLMISREYVIYVKDTVNGGNLLRLDNAGYCPVISPDGKLIALQDTSGYAINILNADNGTVIKRLKGNTEDSGDLCFSPASDMLLSVSENSVARIWDIKSGNQILAYECIESKNGRNDTKYIQFSENGEKALVADMSGSVVVLNTETGKVSAELLTKNNSKLAAVKLSPDGKRIVIVPEGKAALVFDTENGKQLFTLMNNSYIGQANFSPDGSIIATGTQEGHLILWNALTGSEMYNRSTNSKGIQVIEFTPDGKGILTSDEEQANLSDVGNGDSIKSFQLSNGIKCAKFSADGKRLITVSNTTAHVWELNPQYGPAKYKLHTKEINTIKFNRDGSKFITASDDLTAQIVNTKNCQSVIRLKGHKARITDAEFSYDGKLAVTSSEDESTRIWDTGTGDCIAIIKGPAKQASFSPNGRLLLITDEYPYTQCLYDIKSGRKITTFDQTGCIHFNPDGNYLYAGTNNKIQVYDLKGGMVKETQTKEGNFYNGKFSPDGSLILTTGLFDHIVYIWEALSGRLLHELKLGGELQDMEFSPDGKLVGISSFDKKLTVWDLSSGKIIWQKQLTDYLSAFRFSTDVGKLYANYGDVYIWDINNENYCVRIETASEKNMGCFEISPNGDTILWSTKSGGVTVCDMSKEFILKKANDMLNGRGLTAEELQKFFISH